MQFLLVDDNEISLELEKQLLKEYGFSVTCANSGETAVLLACENDFSVIFIDICMPFMNGFETAKKIREFNKSVSIIALSADEISRDSADFIKSGMNGSLLKPLTKNALKKLLISLGIEIHNGASAEYDENALFGYEELLSLVGDSDSVSLVLNSFMDAHANDCNTICKYISERDFLSARAVLHNLTGVAGGLFCRRLYDSCISLSADFRQEKFEGIGTFVEIWDLTTAEIFKHLNSKE